MDDNGLDNFEALDLSMEIAVLREWAQHLTESQKLLFEAQRATINALQEEFKTVNRKLDNIDTHLWSK